MGTKEEMGRFTASLCSRVCSGVTFGFAMLFLALGLWFTHLYARLTPVYTTVSCKFQGASLEDISMSAGLNVMLKVEVTCQNPNPYSIRVEDAKKGKVFMGDDTTEVGSLVKIPPSSLPANSTGSIQAYNSITVSPALMATMFSLLSGDVPIRLELDFDVVIDVSFIFGEFKTTRPFKKDCGMNLAGVPTLIFNPKGARIGPMACADSFNDLVIPTVNAQAPSDGAMDFVGIYIAPEEIAKGKQAKDLGLGLAMGLTYGLSFLLIIIMLACFFCHRCRSRPQAVKESADIVGVDEVNVA